MTGQRPDSKGARSPETKTEMRAGSILLQYCGFIDDPHNKYHVLAYLNLTADESIVFLVNSEVCALIAKDAHLAEGQILLHKDPDYPFLDHDSYLNCTEAFYQLDLDDTLRHLRKEPADLKGELTNVDAAKVIAYVAIAQTISQDDKDLIVTALAQRYHPP